MRGPNNLLFLILLPPVSGDALIQAVHLFASDVVRIISNPRVTRAA